MSLQNIYQYKIIAIENIDKISTLQVSLEASGPVFDIV